MAEKTIADLFEQNGKIIRLLEGGIAPEESTDFKLPPLDTPLSFGEAQDIAARSRFITWHAVVAGSTVEHEFTVQYGLFSGPFAKKYRYPVK